MCDKTGLRSLRLHKHFELCTQTGLAANNIVWELVRCILCVSNLYCVCMIFLESHQIISLKDYSIDNPDQAINLITKYFSILWQSHSYWTISLLN